MDHKNKLDPNEDYNFEFDEPDLRKDSIKTYKIQAKIFKNYFESMQDLSTDAYEDEFYIPKELCEDSVISNFFKYDYTNEKTNNQESKYYFRVRKLRGYFSHCIAFHNLPPLQNIKGRRQQISSWPMTEQVLSKIYKKPEIVRTKKVKQKNILTLEEDAKIRNSCIDIQDPSQVQQKVMMLMSITQSARPATFERADIRRSSIEDKYIDGKYRPCCYIRAYGIKNDSFGDNADTFGTLVFPCNCSSLTNHDDTNDSCMITLFKLQKKKFEKIEMQAKDELIKLQQQLKKQKERHEKKEIKQKKQLPVPKAIEKTKNKIEITRDFLDERTHTYLIYRPKFKSLKCVGFHRTFGRTQVKLVKEKITNIIGRRFVWYDGRATACNIVDKMGKKLGLHVPREAIARSFGRHSKDVMERHYLIPEKETAPIEALNLIREIHDLTGITEKDNPNPFRKQQQILKDLRKNNTLKNKRNSLEILSQNCQIPPSPAPLTSIKNLVQNENLEFNQKKTTNLSQQIEKQGNQKCDNVVIKDLAISSRCSTGNSQIQPFIELKENKNAFMAFMMKQHSTFQKEQDLFLERQQKSKLENQQRFQTMMMNFFKE